MADLAGETVAGFGVESALWRSAPLMLASRSRARAKLLASAGVVFELADSEIDERKTETGVSPEMTARRLAEAKARAAEIAFTNDKRKSRQFLGADQTLIFEGELLHKARNARALRDQLLRLRGRTHRLVSAAVVIENEALAFAVESEAKIGFRKFSDKTLDAYLEAAGPDILECVGGYQIEGLGLNLVETIEGDIFTIMGLPLPQLLARWRERGDMPT